MKTRLIMIGLLLSVALLAVENDLKSLLDVLDQSVANQSYYIEKKQHEIDSLKTKLRLSNDLEQKYYIAQELCFAYSTFMKDSSLIYATKMERFARGAKNTEQVVEAKIDYVRVFSSMGFFKEATAMISTIDPSTLTPRLKAEYMLSQITIYNHQEKFASTPDDVAVNRSMAQFYRDSLLKYEDISPEIKSFLLAATFLYHEQFDPAIVFLDSAFNSYEPYSRNAGILAYSLAKAYHNKNDDDNAIRYYIISSIADLKHGVRANTSLRILANMMFEKGEIDRAYIYMKSALEDAIFCNARINTIEASDMYLLIDKAFQEKEKKKFIIISVLLIAFLLFCIVLFVLVLLIRKQKLKIENINSELSHHLSEIGKINAELLDSSKIKEQYVGLYMEQYTSYLSQIGSFKRKALRIARDGDIQGVILFLHSSLNTEEDHTQFYNNFDKTILNLFPNFVSEFNALLTPESAIVPGQEKMLTPELRIFALIRLGINDSTKISQFLQYSLSTIYNYRTKTRNKAIGNRDEFEDEVLRIDL